MKEFISEIEKKESVLYIISTPIGNRDDITIRALKILNSVDIIACEDTRHTGQLLKSYDIMPLRLESYHEHNETTKAVFLVNEILNGKSVALVTDGGTPVISDPGYRIINEAIDNHIKIIPIPGASAFLPALVASGFPINQFHFYGFPPQKKGRNSFIDKISQQETTSIIYESPFKILKLIDELILHCGETRRVCIAREISKIYEEFIRGTLSDCKEDLSQRQSIKGEFVIVLEGKI
jgi:16S rRNA (cytidine1402-2'-O)-methyltransferase